MINAIAIDDEPQALKVIEHHASKIAFIDLKKVFTDPFMALDYLQKQPIDLIFLDINMPDISGLEFLKLVPHKEVLIIFTTAHSEYAIESYDVEALDYLLKPFEFTRFHTAVSKANKRLIDANKSSHDFFFANTGTDWTKIFYKDISHIEGSGNYVIYYLTEQKVMVRATIKDTLSNLPAGNFFQIQRSFIIALDKIEKIKDNQVYLPKTRISIGPSYRKEFLSKVGGFS
ncbi:MAG: response regulator transcription factor [Cyclobacteriaceae bacterium]